MLLSVLLVEQNLSFGVVYIFEHIKEYIFGDLGNKPAIGLSSRRLYDNLFRKIKI